MSIARVPSLLGALFAFCSALIVPLLALAAVLVLAVLASHGHDTTPVSHLAPGALAGGLIGNTELKSLADDLKSTFEKFKERDAQREAEQKKLGDATAETKAAQDKLNARLDEIELKAQRARTATGLQKIDDEILESRAARSVEQKAFSKWARRGASRLQPDEVKSLTALKYLDHESAEYKALDTDSDVEGGVFVPHQLANRVIQKLILVSPFRALASVETISSNALEIPAEGATSFDAGWVGERSTRPNTVTGSLRLERIPVHELYAQPPVSQTQLDDSVFDVETWLSSRVSTRMAQLEALGFIKGNGVTQPEGVADNAQIPAGQKLTMTAAAFLANAASASADKMIDMWSTLPTFYANEAAWILNRATLGAIRKFKDNNGQYLWQPGGFGVALQNGFPATILGQPYAEMPDMDSVAAGKVPLQLGNFRAGYQIVDRIGMRVIRDNLTQKPFVLFYTTKRVGGQVVLGEAIVQLKTT